jgi:uncharacterized membrane protein
MTVAAPEVVRTASRLAGLDAVRGAAVLLMVADHVSRYVPGGGWFSLTGGRLALPLFCLVAGSLASRLSWRLAVVALLGLLLPVLVPWIDSPNILLLLALSLVLVRWARRASVSLLAVLAVCLGLLVNGWGWVASGYPLPAVLALVVVGALVGRAPLDAWGLALPRWVGVCGRWPLSLYVGHLLVLQVVLGSPS